MRKLTFSTVNNYPNFEKYDLIAVILREIFQFQYIEDFSHADLIVIGPFNKIDVGLFSKIKKKLLTYAANYNKNELLVKSANQVWLHVSGECPNIGKHASFYNSGADFGIGHERSSCKNYYRMPFWYQSLDWETIKTRDGRSFQRFGRPIQPSELLRGVPSVVLREKRAEMAYIGSHVKAPRDYFMKELKEILPLNAYGLEGKGPAQERDGRTKQELLSESRYSFCPENTLYPGYVSEKIVETFASQSVPVGWYWNELNGDFQNNSHLNLENFVRNHGFNEWKTPFLENLKRMEKNGLEPLLGCKPSIEPIIEHLKKVKMAC